jgi:hypothetical protein
MREFSKLNKTQQVIVNAHNIGYYSKDGKCYNPKGEELKSHLKIDIYFHKNFIYKVCRDLQWLGGRPRSNSVTLN